MTETQTLFHPEPVEATWGWYDTTRLATPDEITAAHNLCSECGGTLTDHHGVLNGRYLGRRLHRNDPWTWSGPLCYHDEKAHSVADGY